MDSPFVDRKDGGKQLAQKLHAYKNQSNAIVIGLPRGGVITGAQVAKELNLPLDIVVPRKIGAPFNSELAIGAVTQDGDVVWNEKIMQFNQLKPSDVADTIALEREESLRRLSLYRQGRVPLSLAGKIVILVDDGIATGATIRAAISYVQKEGAKKVIVAAPVAARDSINLIAPLVDELITIISPRSFTGISAFYDQFSQTDDDQVITLLRESKKPT